MSSTSTDWRDEIASSAKGDCLRDAPMAPRTSIRIGGPADLLVRPRDPADLAGLLAACARRCKPATILGGGANMLVADRGIRGVVVRLPPELGEEQAEGTRLLLSAGAPLSRLAARAQAAGLVGCEFTAGIPGTIGGAVAMNAGTRIGEMKDIVTRVEVATAEGLRWLDAAELGFSYRTCRLPPGGVVTRVEVWLREGSTAESAAAMQADREHRRRTQPLNLPTWGSTFRNPPGDHAGRLIEAAGLKGHRIGNAQWSQLHANFVVNLGGATAWDALALIRLARRRVQELFGVDLELEVRLVGDFAGEGIT